MSKVKIEFQTLEDFEHHEVRCNFGNNAEERKRRLLAVDLVHIARELGVRGFIFECKGLEE